MLFTVGTGYFLFVNSDNLLYTQSLSNRASDMQATLGESLFLSPAAGANQHIVITITNQGSQASTIMEFFIVSPSGVVSTITTAASPALPIALNPGATSTAIDTSISIVSGNYAIRVLTQRGAEFTTTYPPTATVLASNALSSGAIGDLYLNFRTWASFSVTRSGCQTTGDYSGWCLTNQQSAFTISGTQDCYGLYTHCDIFSVRVTNLNPGQATITLDQFSVLYQLFPAGPNSKAPYQFWFLISNSSANIYQHYHPITLQYNVAQTLVFAASNCVLTQNGGGPDLGTCTTIPTSTNTYWLQDNGLTCGEPCGDAAATFIMVHGWEYTNPPCNPMPGGCQNFASTNYAQNLPYEGTIYT